MNKKLPQQLDSDTLFRYQVVSTVLSKELLGWNRAQSVRFCRDIPHHHVKGGMRRVSERSIYRWLGAYEKEGLAGLCGSERKTPGTSLDQDFLGFLIAEKEADTRASIPELIKRAKEKGFLAGETNVATLPEDPEMLKQLLAEKEVGIATRDQEIELLRERIRLLQAKLFTPKSEKLKQLVSSEQLSLFLEEDPESSPEDGEQDEEEIIYKRRKKSGRKPIPAYLPRREILHDLPEEKKICECGSCLTRIGEDITEELEYIPPELEVLRHIRPIYTCKPCEKVQDPNKGLVQAPTHPRMIPGIFGGTGSTCLYHNGQIC